MTTIVPNIGVVNITFGRMPQTGGMMPPVLTLFTV